MESNSPSMNSYDDSLNQNFDYAGFWVRFVALLLDAVIMIIPSVLIHFVIPVVGSFLISILYKPFFESSALMATPGKALMGLRVVNLNGGRLSLRQAFIRYVGTILSSALLLVGYIMAAFTARNQALHDMIADTLVIRRAPPTINYLEAWINEVQSAFGFGSAPTQTQNTNDRATDFNMGPVATGANTGTSAGGNVSAKIEELHALFLKGILTEEEYRTKKEELLKSF